MSPTPPTLNPSQTVERIREIIVGRHLERLEGRVARLESRPEPASSEIKKEAPIFEDRLMVSEAKIEALEDHVHRIEGFRQESEQRAAAQLHEAQQLAARIQEIARQKADETALPAVQALETKLGTWLTEWQKSLHLRLEDRDRKLVERIHGDLAEFREAIGKRMDDLESRVPEGVADRLDRIAVAARALAESATSFSNATSAQP